jgi:hypothetical protein
VGSEIFLGWRTKARLSDSEGEEVWVKQVWMSPGPVLDWTIREESLPRAAHRSGDQRRIAFAARTVNSKPQLVAAYDDLGGTFSAPAQASAPVVPPTTGVVALQVIPAPMNRYGEVSGPRCVPGVPYRLAAILTASESAAGYPPNYADDQDEATPWIASLDTSTANNQAWVQLDLGSSKQVDRLRWIGVNGSPALARSPSEYTIETSDDSVTWSVVTARVSSSVTNGSEFVGKTARYVRLKTTKVFDGSGAALGLFEIWAEGVGFAPGAPPRWQVYDSFDQDPSSHWIVVAGGPVTSGGKLYANSSTSGVVEMLSRTSFATRSVHFKDIHEVPGSGRCWIAGMFDAYTGTGMLVRRDLNPDYVDASTQDHLFFHIAPTSGEHSFTDLGAFSAGPGLDVTYARYGSSLHVDISKDGGALLHREVDTSLVSANLDPLIVTYCEANISIEDVLATAP